MTCFLINRSSREILDRKVAEKVWTDSPIDYFCFRVYRCLAYVHDFSGKRSKIDTKSRQYIFLGH